MGSYRSTVKESFSWRQTLQLHHQSPDQKREWGIEAAQLITHTTPSHSTRKYNPSFPHGAASNTKKWSTVQIYFNYNFYVAYTNKKWQNQARGHMYRQCPLRLLEGSENVRRHQETNRARGRGSRAATGAEPAAPAVCSAAAAAPAPLPLLALRPPLAPLAMLRLPPPMAPISLSQREELNNYDFMSESE
ncbi:hypothetical protein DTO027B6_8313 [Paecilomyces variotii]|nr:hypothetical protein DTO032I3_5306 [Paecilomyces variotii]KAJ9339147.1 hypothetical protein DTO027B6_8313 [Paecilomyces variotii]KAJ9393675.1 hypothetical protein DTO032I4_446 [Paecilomyces variotii]